MARNGRGRPRERAPLNRGNRSTFYGAAGSTPRPPGIQSPPPYAAIPDSHDEEQQTDVDYFKQRLSLGSPIITTLIAGTVIFILAGQLLAFIYFDDIPTKVGEISKAENQLRTQEEATWRAAKHLESERTRLRDESTRLEKERLALDSSTLKMEGERQALESTIRHSEQERSKLDRHKQLMEAERSRLEKQVHLLENERESLEREEMALREERERWEMARDEQTIPKGAFWEVVWPAWDCRAYGKREYWGVLRNIPEGRSEMDACMNMPVEIRDVVIRRPYRCQWIGGSIHGFWMVDWGQPDCKPWHQNFIDMGCTNRGSGLRRLEAEVVGINDKGGQDWSLLCETTPMIWDHITYKTPLHCEDRGRKMAIWNVLDDRC